MSTINSEKIKAKMVELGLTQAKLAEMLKMSTTSLNNKLQGKCEFTASEIFSMSHFLDIENKDDYFFVQKGEYNSQAG